MSEDRRPERTVPSDVAAAADGRGDVPSGARVRVKSGAFAGKSGVAAGYDAKGFVLVVLGQITVTLAPEEVELAPGAARGKTVLSSSHVKQPAARSRAAGKTGGKKR